MAAEVTKRVLGKRAPDGVYEIPILGDIGLFGVDGADLLRELMAVKPTQVKFIIYSPGGSVWDAIAVAGYIQEHGIECYAEIYGLCASAATVFAACAGPKRTAIAPGSSFMIHMPYWIGGASSEADQKHIDDLVDHLVMLYSKTYGWSKAEARKHMEANNGDGILWTAEEAKSIGVVSEVMKMSVAAHFNTKQPAMADNKKTITMKVKAKLTTMEALRAAVGDGTELEVEVPVEDTTAAAIAEKDARIAELEKENAELTGKVAESAADQESRATLETEANAAKAALAAAASEHEKAVAALNKAHADAIAELKKPMAKATVADNQDGAVAAMPGAVKSEKSEFVGQVFAGMTEVQKAQHEATMKRRKTQQ